MSVRKYRNISSIFALLFLFFSIPAGAQSGKNGDKKVASVSDRIFSRAQQHYKNDDYWACSRELIFLLDFHPDFSRTDEAVFMFANCLYESGLYASAEKMYKHLLRNHVRSSRLPEAIVGLERLAYERGNYQKTVDYYKQLMRCNPEQHIVNLACYYAGMAFYKLDDYPSANQSLALASSKSPYYDYCLYMRAMSLLRMKNIDEALDYLQKLCTLPITTEERRHVVDETHLTLGYVYYEMGYYQDAISHFYAVSPSSEQYQNALLGAGWAAAKQEKWRQAVIPLTELVSVYDKNDVTFEGMFLLGRCYLKMQKYDSAVKIYDHMMSGHQNLDSSPQSDSLNAKLTQQQKELEKGNMHLLTLESQLVHSIHNNEKTLNDYLNGNIKLSPEQSSLWEKIQNERKELSRLEKNIARLENQFRVRGENRNWQAYAEYGRTRALFLKRQQERN